MLIDFKFKNYSSFKEKVQLNLKADKITEFSNTLIHYTNFDILPVSSIFGPNESGKSNFIQALKFFKNKIIGCHHKPNSFAFTNNPSASCFKIKFLLDNKIISYGFTFNEKGEILTEELTIQKASGRKPETIFKRNGQEIKLNKSLRKYNKQVDLKLKNNELLLSFLKSLKEESISKIYQWFVEIDIVDSTELSNTNLTKNNLQKLLKKPEDKKNLLEFLDIIDSKIIDIYYDKTNEEFLTVHKKENKKDSLKLKNESSGILKIIVLYPFISKALNSGLPLFIDDLDEHLHLLLLRHLIVNFLNPKTNPKQGQLIFTTNNFSILDMNLLRRDEIWFVEKNNNISELYSLTDFRDNNGKRIRKDKNFLNKYFLGQFGAIPNIKDKSIL